MNDQPSESRATKNLRARGPNGRYHRTLEGAARDAEAARMRSDGYGYQAIADHFGMSVSNAFEAVKRALQTAVQEAAADARAVEVARLDESLKRLDGMTDTVIELLERKHYTVSNGRVVCLDEEPLEDDGFVLQAVDRLNTIETQRNNVARRRAALLGMDIPVKQEIDLSGGVTYQIVGVDPEALK